MNIIGLGDSLMQFNSASTYPQSGWLQEFDRFLKDPKETKILDFAVNGTSTKSFVSKGYYAQALQAAEKGDIVFISFGHNDEKGYDKERYTEPFKEYQDNLKRFFADFSAKGATVIFLSSVARIQFNKDGKTLKKSHGDYPEAMKEAAEKIGAYFIDLEQLTRADYERKGFDEDRRYIMYFGPNQYPNYPQGKEDTTHLRVEGAVNICFLLLPELKKIAEIKPYLLDLG
jgi:lysophospholipase L1-like esterase